MRRLVLLGSLAALVLAPPASAKMCVTIATVPARPVAGEQVTIRMTAWSIRLANGKPRRGGERIPLHEGARFAVRLAAPDGSRRRVVVRRRSDAASVLEARFVFSSAGTWTLAWSAFPPGAADACAGRTLVRVG